METPRQRQERVVREAYCAWCLRDFAHGSRIIVITVNGSLALIHENCHITAAS